MPQNPKSKIEPYLRGNLLPRRTDHVDIRNDNAGSELQQTQSIILRYLELIPAQDVADIDSMVEDITRHYPFIGESRRFFEEAIKDLKEKGWVKVHGDQIWRDKVAVVTRRYLSLNR